MIKLSFQSKFKNMEKSLSINEISRKTKFSKFSDKISLVFKGHNLEDFQYKISMRENLHQNKHFLNKQIVMNKKMEKLDKLSENIKSSFIFKEISNSQSNMMESINKVKDENSKEKNENFLDNIKIKVKKNINKNKIVHSLLLNSANIRENGNFTISPKGNNKSSISLSKPKEIITFKEAYNSTKSLELLSPLHTKKKEEKKIVYESPCPGKYNPNYSLVHKKVPSLFITEKEINNKHKSFIDKVRDIENEKMKNLKLKIEEKETKRIKKIKKKNTISINYSQPPNFSYLVPKIKTVDFNKYLKRKEFVASVSLDAQTSIDQVSSHSKKEKHLVNYDKMTNREVCIKRSRYHFLSPEVGYYHPNFDSILTNHNTSINVVSIVTPFSNVKQNKYPLQKILSKYDVQLEFKSIKLSENNA